VAALNKEMKVVITGADGQLGRSFQDALKLKGIAFLALSRKTMDVTNLAQVRSVLGSTGASLIINSAAYTNVEQAEINPEIAFAINQVGSRNVAIVCRELDSRLIHISTDYVFSGNRDLPWQVDSDARPLSVYGKSKLAGENAIREEWSENSLIVRTAWLYSQYGKNFYKTILQLANKDKSPIKVVNNQVGQPTSAPELASFILSTFPLEIPAGVYHATNSGSATWYDFAYSIFQLAGADTGRIEPISAEDYNTKAPRPDYSVLDNSKWDKYDLNTLGDWEYSVANAFSTIQESMNK
jgi:dTDP-4-dehydrorhamnose reductase